MVGAERQLIEEFVNQYTLKAIADFAKQEFGNRLSVYAVQGLITTIKMQVDSFFEKRYPAPGQEKQPRETAQEDGHGTGASN